MDWQTIQQIFLSVAEIYSHEDNANAFPSSSNYVDRLQRSLVPFLRLWAYAFVQCYSTNGN